MKINGSLIFDASSASEIQNLRVEKLTALPTFGSSDNGRLVYNTTNNTMYFGQNGGWISIATGGNAATLQAEVDAIEASLGGLVGTDGTYNAGALTGTLASSTSVTNVFEKIQALIAAEVTRATAAEGVLTTDLAAEVTRATGVEGDLQDAIDAEVTRATAAEGVLTTDLASEVTRATTAEGVLTTNLSAEVTRATAAEGVLTTAIATEASTARAAETKLTGDLATEASTARAAEATLTTNLATEASTARAAEATLTADLAAEVTRATGAESTLTTNLAAEATTARAAELTLTTNLATEVSRATAQEALIRDELAAAVVGLTWEAPVNEIVTELPTTGFALGDRFALTTDHKIYTATSTSEFDAGEEIVNGGAFFDLAIGGAYTYNGTAIVQFNGTSAITAGAGMLKSGNTLFVASDSETITVSENSIDVAQSVLDSIALVQTNLDAEVTARIADVDAEQTRATTAEGVLTTALAQEVTDRVADVDAEEARAIAAEGVLTTAVAAEATRATAAEGVLTTAVATEASTARAAEAALSTSISNEVTRATAAEGVLTTAVAAEVTRATAAEGVLTTDLASEVTRATTAEAAIEAKIGKMYFLYSGASSDTHTVTHNLGQRYCNVTVLDDSNEVVIPQSITFTGDNALVVTFNTAIVCKVVVMGLAAV